MRDITASERSSNRPRSHRIREFLVTSGVLALGIAVGSAISQDGTSSAPDRIVLENPVPPVLAIPQDGSAIIGAADNKYYLLKSNGRIEELFVGRHEMRWR